ncbi:MAG TPA: hypothetical protein VF092_31660 [Longimicrobium sp.]
MSTVTQELPGIRVSDALPRAVRAAPGGPAISSAPMLIRERALHSGLLRWSTQLRETIGETLRESRDVYRFAYEFSRVGNNTALIAVHDGAGRVAAGLVKRQLRWINRLIRRSGVVAITDFTVSPWINHARLDTFTGEWESALRRLEAVEECRRRNLLRLGHGVPGLNLDAPDREGYKRYLRDLYVSEGLKALLVNARWQEALDFAASLGEDDPDWIRCTVDEAVAVAACRLGDYERAGQACVDGIRRVRGWEGAALRVRRAEVLACAGETGRARTAITGFLPAFCSASIEPDNLQRVLAALYPMLRAAQLCEELGMDDESAAVAERTYAVASRAGDEVFAIESARVLARVAPDSEPWMERVERLETGTMYKRFRRGPRDEERGETLDRLYEEAAAAFDML